MSGNITKGVVTFICGGVLGWTLHANWLSPASPEIAYQEDDAPAQGLAAESESVTTQSSRSTEGVGRLARLLREEHFEDVIQLYFGLANNADEAAVQLLRNMILQHARELKDTHRYQPAAELLTQYIYNEFRDVEARELLSNIYGLQDDYLSQLNTLYEARVYAYRPATLRRIKKYIRTTEAIYRSQLITHNDYQGLLELYQLLTQLEPDHPDHFLGLAEAKLGLKDYTGARQSLNLVIDDPSVSNQVNLLLARLEKEDPVVREREITGIPLEQAGEHYVVEAWINNTTQIKLLIDTGASLTIIQPNTLSASGADLQNAPKIGQFHTVNGPTRGPIVVLNNLAVGEYVVNNLEVGALEVTTLSGADGLLGMNYLKHFEFFIDQRNGVLRLTPRALQN